MGQRDREPGSGTPEQASQEDNLLFRAALDARTGQLPGHSEVRQVPGAFQFSGQPDWGADPE